MSDTRDLLRPAVEGFEPAADAFERVLVRRDRKRRNARVAAGILGVAIFALAALGLARLLESERTTGPPEPTQPTNGRWVVFSALHLDPDPDAPQVSRGQDLNLYVSDGDGTARLLVGAEGEHHDRGIARPSPQTERCSPGERRRVRLPRRRRGRDQRIRSIGPAARRGDQDPDPHHPAELRAAVSGVVTRRSADSPSSRHARDYWSCRPMERTRSIRRRGLPRTG